MFPIFKDKRRALAVLIGLALLITAGVLTAGGQFDPPAGDDWISASVADLQLRLDQSTNPAEQDLLQDKLNRLNHIQQARQEAGIQSLPPQPEELCPALPQAVETPAQREEGILLLEEHDYEDLDLMADNGWQGWVTPPQGGVNGNWVRVLAGRSLATSGGKLLVFTENVGFQGFDLPAPLRIESASGSRLVLRDADGAAYFFDVAARQFLAAPDEIVAPLSPLPTFTPEPSLCP